MSDPNVNDPHILDGYLDGNDLLGWDDDAPLMGWAPSIVEGLFDTSTEPLGGPVGDRVYLVTATLQAEGAMVGAPSPEGAGAIGSAPIAGFPFEGASAELPPVHIRLANRGFVTIADDPDLPSVWFDDRVRDPGSLALTLPLVPVGGSAIETTIGQVRVDNADGAFDTLLDQVVAISQPVRILGGRLGIEIGDFVTIFEGRITGIAMTEEVLTLDLQSPILYAQNLYPTSIYTGLGGAAGDAELEGVVKPVVLGRVWNMSPVLVNATALIYQAHDGEIAAVTGVFDGGVALTFTANHANYAALAGASLSGGQYATCLGEGLIRVGGTPAYALTAHVDGAGGTTVRAIAKWLIGQLDDELGLAVDLDSFDALPAWTAGWLWTDAFAFADAISRFVGDGGYYWGADSDGTVRALTLAEPADPVTTYDTSDILSIERLALPQGYEGVHHRRQVRFQRNWTLQSDGELAATATTRARRQRGWGTATVTATAPPMNAIDPPIVETSLYTSADAAALAGILIGLHGRTQRMFSVETKIFGALPRLGETVTIAHPRFGLADGIAFRVVAIDLDLAENNMRLLLWG